jgi:tetratricopeptide (TPR) repeat protein
LEEAERRYPTNLMFPWLRARVAADAGRLEEALDYLDGLLAVDLETLPDGGVAYDGRIFGVFAHSLRGLCLLRLGRNAEAANAYRAAEALEPEVLEHRVKRQLAEART